MQVNSDFRDLLQALGRSQVRYLVVGGYAVMFHTEPRFTKDLDLWVEPTPENSRRVWDALADFGAPLDGVSPEDFCNPEVIYQIGVEPIRIDIMMKVPGVEFAPAYENRAQSTYAGAAIDIIGVEDLLRAKRTAGRPQDLLDVSRLGGEDKA